MACAQSHAFELAAEGYPESAAEAEKGELALFESSLTRFS